MAETPIGSIAAEIERIAVEHGYEGPTGMSIVGAMDALADTLAGEDVHGGATIAEAVRAIAPHIGSGGGGGTQYGENYAMIGQSLGLSPLSPDFNPNNVDTNDSYVLWDAVGGKQVIMSSEWPGAQDITAKVFLDGTTATWVDTYNRSVNQSGAVEAAVLKATSVDLDNGNMTFDIIPYEGVTFDSSTHRFVIPVHDIPEPLHVEDVENDVSVDYPAKIVFFVQMAAPTPPI